MVCFFRCGSRPQSVSFREAAATLSQRTRTIWLLLPPRARPRARSRSFSGEQHHCEERAPYFSTGGDFSFWPSTKNLFTRYANGGGSREWWPAAALCHEGGDLSGDEMRIAARQACCSSVVWRSHKWLHSLPQRLGVVQMRCGIRPPAPARINRACTESIAVWLALAPKNLSFGSSFSYSGSRPCCCAYQVIGVFTHLEDCGIGAVQHSRLPRRVLPED